MSPVLCATESGVATIRLNRPARLNALDEAMLVGLRAALREARHRKDVRAVLLTGNGRGFCSGAELRSAAQGERDVGELLRDLYHPLILELSSLPKPTVVAVNGVAAGAGFSIALAGDILLGSESASFCLAFSRIGLIPDAGCTYHLPRVVGVQRAKALAMLAEQIDAHEAAQLGILHKVFPCERLMDEAQAMAQRLAAMPSAALALTKQAFGACSARQLEDQLELEAKLQSIAAGTQDFREGVEAFLNRRAPVFTGS
jgi:2-(1,2-epoxy-1,2-dihydrophenyl)acetyl-CoA isomerase